ncbi:hypothetical protein [Streptomyces sp. NPDC059564]|uniref:hypothetical protein n=1 Tax=Streptomyces sp. NPDC059564 TaxID=3346865 RepID=UPI0036993E82
MEIELRHVQEVVEARRLLTQQVEGDLGSPVSPIQSVSEENQVLLDDKESHVELEPEAAVGKLRAEERQRDHRGFWRHGERTAEKRSQPF